jgi:hypothetical protein
MSNGVPLLTLPLLSRKEYEAKTETNAEIIDSDRTDWSYKSRLDTDVPDDEFTLTTFSLPEPEPWADDLVQRSYSLCWVFGGTAICLALAWLARYQNSRDTVNSVNEQHPSLRPLSLQFRP